MPAPARDLTDTLPVSAGQRSFREVCQAAMRVFTLMDKHRTAPYPNAYAVLFAYTTGSDEALVAEVNSLLQLKDQLTPYDIESLFQEYLVDDTGTFTTQGIGQAIGTEIGAVLEIIEKGLKQNDAFTQSLDTFSEKVPQAASGENLSAVVSGLLEENRRMADLTRDLNQGLAKSQNLISVLNHQLEEVQAQAMRDPVTATANRRAFDKRLDEEVSRAAKTHDSFCVVLCSIDNFSSLTDAYGYDAGETVLRNFAVMLGAHAGEAAMVARYGAEEFALIIPARELMGAYNLLVKIKHAFKTASHDLTQGGQVVTGLTACFGLSRFEPGMTARDIIGHAETQYREARKSGSNVVKARGFP